MNIERVKRKNMEKDGADLFKKGETAYKYYELEKEVYSVKVARREKAIIKLENGEEYRESLEYSQVLMRNEIFKNYLLFPDMVKLEMYKKRRKNINSIKKKMKEMLNDGLEYMEDEEIEQLLHTLNSLE